MEVLIAFEERIFHNLPTNIFHLTNPEVQILISICSTLQQVEAFYATIVNSVGHSLMKIGINVLGVEFRILQHLNDLFQLSCSPPVGYTINYSMYLVCTWYELVFSRYVLVCTSYVLACTSTFFVCTAIKPVGTCIPGHACTRQVLMV